MNIHQNSAYSFPVKSFFAGLEECLPTFGTVRAVLDV